MRRAKKFACFLTATTMMSGAAAAQDGLSQDANRSGELGEIVVTARKSSENLQNAAVSVTAAAISFASRTLPAERLPGRMVVEMDQ